MQVFKSRDTYHELLRRIEEHDRSSGNRSMRDREKERRNRNKDNGEEKKRKVRTTITPLKLE